MTSAEFPRRMYCENPTASVSFQRPATASNVIPSCFSQDFYPPQIRREGYVANYLKQDLFFCVQRFNGTTKITEIVVGFFFIKYPAICTFIR